MYYSSDEDNLNEGFEENLEEYLESIIMPQIFEINCEEYEKLKEDFRRKYSSQKDLDEELYMRSNDSGNNETLIEIKALIDLGADINFRSDDHRRSIETPLFQSLISGKSVEITKFLLAQNNIDILTKHNFKRKDGSNIKISAFDFALNQDNFEALYVLYNHLNRYIKDYSKNEIIALRLNDKNQISPSFSKETFNDLIPQAEGFNQKREAAILRKIVGINNQIEEKLNAKNDRSKDIVAQKHLKNEQLQLG